MKTLREYIDQLDEISRRDALKYAGATALGGAIGYGIHKGANQDQYVNPMFHRLVGRLSEYQTSGAYKAEELNQDKRHSEVAGWITTIKSQLLNPAMNRSMIDSLYKEYQLGQQEAKTNIKTLSPEEIKAEFDDNFMLVHQALDIMKNNKGFDRQKYEKSFKEQSLEESEPEDPISKIDRLFR